MQNWKRDPRASLLVESGEEYAELRGVVVYARTEVIEDYDIVVNTLVNINSKNRDLNEEQRQNITIECIWYGKQKSWHSNSPRSTMFHGDHTKLGGRY